VHSVGRVRTHGANRRALGEHPRFERPRASGACVFVAAAVAAGAAPAYENNAAKYALAPPSPTCEPSWSSSGIPVAAEPGITSKVLLSLAFSMFCGGGDGVKARGEGQGQGVIVERFFVRFFVLRCRAQRGGEKAKISCASSKRETNGRILFELCGDISRYQEHKTPAAQSTHLVCE